MKTKLISCLLVIISLYGLKSQELNDSLQLYLKFDGAVLQDLSSNSFDCNPYQISFAEGLNEMPLGASSFNGFNSYIDCGSGSLGLTKELSISAWIKTTSQNQQYFVTKYNWQEDKGFHLGTSEGKLSLGGRDNSGVYQNTGPSQTFVSDGNWHHVVGIINENSWQIWVNCRKEAEVTSSSNNVDINSSTEPLSLGYWHYGTAMGAGNGQKYFYGGQLDEVRVYNRALSSEEISSLCDFTLLEIEMASVGTDLIKIYPNPATNIIKIPNKDFGSEVFFEIRNFLGQIVQTGRVNDEINISSLKSGGYLLFLRDKRTLKFSKFIKL